MTFEKWSNKIYLLILFTISFVLFYLNFENREYGWDMPGYLGSYYLVENPSNNLNIQENVYALIKSEAPKFQYEKMVGFHVKGNWNDWISKNGDAFNLQISYYSIKVFYVFLIFCFHKIGFSLPIAAFLPNIISFFIFGFVLYSIFKEILKDKKLIPFILTLIVLLIPPFRYLATIPSPDMLTVLILTWFGYSVVKKQELYIQFMILMLVIFSRPDFIIFGISYLGIYFLYHLYKKRKINWMPIVFGVGMMATYFLILKINNYPGWKDVFYDSFIQRRMIITGNANFSFHEYRQVFLDNITNFKKITLISLVCLIAVFYFTKDLWVRSLAALLVLNVFFKFAFFPAPGEYRFFIGFILLLFITSVYSAKDKIRNLTR
ncbi:hypothetical protein IV494_13280 [Kaistella sp. G5-32]|uniref:Dolichyl-phosphate-mannose-protein mannosyltransferase n=1 Tax=Kaistella gelatinilytica TaxID=2787636 RepID=A0ABS0FEL8_9FLAO|nr:hypothetical protein [Kaistella gelatinilytica]MBF8458150.1 hypothetical protein [Kaistella gelatinilytica]